MAITAAIRKEFEAFVEPKNVKDRTVFVLKPLSGDVFTECSMAMESNIEEIKKGPEFVRLQRKALKSGLKGWRNFRHPETKADIPFPENIEEAVDLLGFRVRNRLFTELITQSSIDQGLRKN